MAVGKTRFREVNVNNQFSSLMSSGKLLFCKNIIGRGFVHPIILSIDRKKHLHSLQRTSAKNLIEKC
jgi:hypothetical protein